MISGANESLKTIKKKSANSFATEEETYPYRAQVLCTPFAVAVLRTSPCLKSDISSCTLRNWVTYPILYTLQYYLPGEGESLTYPAVH